MIAWLLYARMCLTHRLRKNRNTLRKWAQRNCKIYTRYDKDCVEQYRRQLSAHESCSFCFVKKIDDLENSIRVPPHALLLALGHTRTSPKRRKSASGPRTSVAMNLSAISIDAISQAVLLVRLTCLQSLIVSLQSPNCSLKMFHAHHERRRPTEHSQSSRGLSLPMQPQSMLAA